MSHLPISVVLDVERKKDSRYIHFVELRKYYKSTSGFFSNFLRKEFLSITAQNRSQSLRLFMQLSVERSENFKLWMPLWQLARILIDSVWNMYTILHRNYLFLFPVNVTIHSWHLFNNNYFYFLWSSEGKDT